MIILSQPLLSDLSFRLRGSVGKGNLDQPWQPGSSERTLEVDDIGRSRVLNSHSSPAGCPAASCILPGRPSLEWPSQPSLVYRPKKSKRSRLGYQRSAVTPAYDIWISGYIWHQSGLLEILTCLHRWQPELWPLTQQATPKCIVDGSAERTKQKVEKLGRDGA